jgi:hypothetical protein
MNIQTMSKRGASVNKWLGRRNRPLTNCFFSVVGECHATFLNPEKKFDRVARALIGAMRLNSDLMERLNADPDDCSCRGYLCSHYGCRLRFSGREAGRRLLVDQYRESTLVNAAKTNLFETAA